MCVRTLAGPVIAASHRARCHQDVCADAPVATPSLFLVLSVAAAERLCLVPEAPDAFPAESTKTNVDMAITIPSRSGGNIQVEAFEYGREDVRHPASVLCSTKVDRHMVLFTNVDRQ